MLWQTFPPLLYESMETTQKLEVGIISLEYRMGLCTWWTLSTALIRSGDDFSRGICARINIMHHHLIHIPLFPKDEMWTLCHLVNNFNLYVFVGGEIVVSLMYLKTTRNLVSTGKPIMMNPKLSVLLLNQKIQEDNIIYQSSIISEIGFLRQSSL